MDVHDDLDVFLRTETQRNKYLAVSITNETACRFCHDKVSDHTMDRYLHHYHLFYRPHFSCRGIRDAYAPLMLVEFQGFHFNIELPISIKHDILFGNSCLWCCYGPVPPFWNELFFVIELSNWSFYFQWDIWLLVYQFCIIRTKEHTSICILGQPFPSYGVLIVRT